MNGTTQNSDGKFLHKELSYKILGIIFEIRKQYGPGHKEKVYHNLIKEKLALNKINFEAEKRISFKSVDTGKTIGLYVPDFLIDNKIVLEIKATRFSVKEDEKQLYYYLKNGEYEIGYLINFNTNNLFWKRMVYTNNFKPFLSKKLNTLKTDKHDYNYNYNSA